LAGSLFCGALLAALTSSLSAAEIQAWLSQTTTSRGEPVEMVLEISGEAIGEPMAQVDLSVLDGDFRIVDRRASESVRVVNGVRSERFRLILRLLPMRVGEIAIPPIRVGDQSTPALALTVRESTAGHAPAATRRDALPTEPIVAPRPDATAAMPTAAVVVEAVPSEVRVGQQVLLTARVVTRGALSSGWLHDPQPEDALVMPLGEERASATRDGEAVDVYERLYALFPEEPGRFVIAPLVFEAQPFGAGPAGEGIRAASRAVAVTVRAPPEGLADEDWVPARDVTLSEAGASSERVVAPGQPLERLVTMTAVDLPASALPELAVAAPFELQVRRDAPQLWNTPTQQGIVGHRRERIALTGQAPGRYRLPELQLSWWDTVHKVERVATLPASTMIVQDPREARTEESPHDAGDEPPGQGRTANAGLAAAVALALVGIGLFLFRRRRRGERPVLRPAAAPGPEPGPASRRASAVEELARPSDPDQEALAAVRAAYEAGNPSAARNALLAWSRLHWPADPPGNLAQLLLRCPEPVRGQIALLEKAFFSPEPIRWEREPVWEGLAAIREPG
jgi:hypothetical protein